MSNGNTQQSAITISFAAIGATCVGLISCNLCTFIWRHYLRRKTNLAERYGAGGNWSIVTGATSGIGRGCVLELAKQGFNVVLIARNKSNLDDLVKEIQEKYGVKGMAVPMDASTATDQDLDLFVERLKRLDHPVAILVNCIGIHNSRPCNVDEMQGPEAEKIIRTNCTFPVLLTSKVISLLKNNTSEGGRRSAILNVGSLTSTTPMATMSTYAATKAFNAHWSRCLAAEMAPFSIDVLCVRPGLTATPMSGEQNPGGTIADPNDIATKSLGMLGLGVKSILPFPPHAVLDYIGSIMPESTMDKMVRQMQREKQIEFDNKAK